jgi:hypothetical protein
MTVTMPDIPSQPGVTRPLFELDVCVTGPTVGSRSSWSPEPIWIGFKARMSGAGERRFGTSWRTLAYFPKSSHNHVA